MNTTTESPATLPDYVIAKQELKALFQSLGLKATKVGAHYAEKPATTKGDKPWAHVALTVIVTDKTGNTVSMPYKMGLGLADWRNVLRKTAIGAGKDSIEYRRVKLMMQNRLASWAQRDLVEKHLSAYVTKCSPAEVLAFHCREGEDASSQTFADWCAEYGYDEDSRKAEATYRACQDAATTVRKVLSRADVVKFAELSGRL